MKRHRPKPRLQTQVAIRLPNALLSRLDAIALYQISPRAAVVRRLLVRALESEESAL
jgi:hypothetical protein